MRILLLEDDQEQADLLKHWLESAGFYCTVASSASQMKTEMMQDSFDIYVLDRQLPQGSGVQVLQEIRNLDDVLAPVLMVTQSGDEADIVEALNLGADDYLVKPVREQELIARIKALHRRYIGFSGDNKLIEYPPYRFDLKSRQAYIDGEPIKLTNKEFDLAVFLFRNVGRVVSRGHMLQSVWGTQGQLTTRKVDTHISHLRQRLGIADSPYWRLSSVYQQGYRLEQVAPYDEETAAEQSA